MRRRSYWPALAALTLIGCGSAPVDSAPRDSAPRDSTPADIATTDLADAPDAPPAEGPCDPIDPAHCMFPFPSNLYLTPDPTRPTGFTLDFANALPRNVDGKPIDSAPYRRLDGYGVGTPLLVSFPNLDRTGLATEDDTAPSLAADAPILWFEATPDGLRRVSYFVDDDVAEADPAAKVLIVRPAAILHEHARYVVAFRDLRDTHGAVFASSPAFSALRAGTASGYPELAPRVAGFERVFADLTKAGVARASLQLAWDFTTASCEALHGPLQHMIADAFATVGAQGPAFSDIEVEAIDDGTTALEIRATIDVPHYLKSTPSFHASESVWTFNLGADGLPSQNGTAKAPVWIRIPTTAIPANGAPAVPHGLILYGHGQTGAGTQVRGAALAQIAHDGHYIFVATDMWGMSESDLPGIIDLLLDLSGFPRVADRLQQGLLNHVLLARAMRERLPVLAEITSRGIVIDPSRIYYMGISQGGIFGASIVALSPDLQRGHLGVPGNNYGFLLTRSRNFIPFMLGIQAAYPERWQQHALVATIELLWEQSDPVSYMRHLHAAPFPGQGPNEVLLAPAKGDVQVAVASNEWLARSDLGIAVMTPYDRERPFPALTETATYPRTGSGIVLYDFGNPWPNPSENAPPTSDAPDPHGLPRVAPNHNRQLVHFLETGEIIDVCSDDGSPGCTPE